MAKLKVKFASILCVIGSVLSLAQTPYPYGDPDWRFSIGGIDITETNVALDAQIGALLNGVYTNFDVRFASSLESPVTDLEIAEVYLGARPLDIIHNSSPRGLSPFLWQDCQELEKRGNSGCGGMSSRSCLRDHLPWRLKSMAMPSARA